ncbi:DoxX-like family protein [Gilvimarinus polysaccharolyticus]|uniref:DoxX-like family protein n=1 Tax=Gilvimarinus polysaccharolyticus TaxID=863921 RepID=UPI0006735E6D|nr:DoxX-like family protein [Gilvimarinus polysaccharolyticus]
MQSDSLNYLICRTTVALIWLYHGLVPKLLGPHADELGMNMAIGLNEYQATVLSYIAGVSELIFGTLVLLLWRKQWPLLASAILMVGLLGFAMVFQPALSLAAFNPVTTNISVLALSIVAYRLNSTVKA